MSHDWELHHSELMELASPSSLVCSVCVTDEVLWDQVASAVVVATCSFCHAAGICVSFGDIEPVVLRAVERFYETFSESGAFHEYGEPSEQVEDIRDIVGELLIEAVDGDAWMVLREYIADRDATEYGWVSRNSLWATLYDFHEGDWRKFIEDARAGEPKDAQALSKRLKPELGALFAKITRVTEIQGLYKSARPELWRCRGGSLDDGFRTAQHIGTAPSGLAAAGRLNKKGDSYFYGGTTKVGAVRESAKHGGADAELWIGKFKPSRDIYHLDLMEIPEEPSPFLPDAADTRDALNFLQRFSETISQPNDPTDKQHYLPTQAFAAYLIADPDGPEAIRFKSSLDPTSDNWIVFVDRDHCVDGQAPGGGDLYLVLDPATVEHLVASDVVGDPS